MVLHPLLLNRIQWQVFGQKRIKRPELCTREHRTDSTAQNAREWATCQWRARRITGAGIKLSATKRPHERLKTSDIHDPTLPSKKGRGTGRKSMHGSITDLRLSSRKTRPSRVPQMRQNLRCTTKHEKDGELNKFTATIASPGIWITGGFNLMLLCL